MAVLALAAVWVIQAVEPAPVAAVTPLACCQDCEAQEQACYAACDDNTHTSPDTVTACYQDCYDDSILLSCWMHCMYCEPPGEEHCYLADVTEKEVQFPYPHIVHEVNGIWEVGCDQ
jgi:hypothetical protein